MNIEDQTRYYTNSVSGRNENDTRTKKLNFYYSGDQNDLTKEEVKDGSIFDLSWKEFLKTIPRTISEKNYSTHILTVGFSIQPIIFSILALKCKKVVLIYSEDTKGECSRIVAWLKRIQVFLKDDFQYTFIGQDEWNNKKCNYCVDSSNPADIFKKLQVIVKEFKVNNEKIAVNITGGKKSMVVGAYMAASINKWDVFYVDFREYENDKPKFGTEFLMELPNLNEVNDVVQKLRNKKIKFSDVDQKFIKFIPQDLIPDRNG